MSYLSKDQILQANDLPSEDVAVPEWGGVVRVRALTGAERDAYEASIVERKGNRAELDMRNIRAKLVAMCVVDENGNRLFTDREAALLGQKSAAALDRVFQVAQRLSGLRPEDLEEMSKN